MPTEDQISGLERLTKLRDSGALNDAEFEDQKAKLLSGTTATAPTVYRRLWAVVTLTCLLLTFPLALLILITGDVYRKRTGGWSPISRGGRLVYASILGLWLAAVVIRAILVPETLRQMWEESAPDGSPSVAQTSAGGAAAPDACESSDAADMVKNAIEDSAASKLVSTKVLDFGHAHELYYDTKANVRYCGADGELNTGASKLSYKLYFGPSGGELVEVQEGEDAFGAKDMAAEAAAVAQAASISTPKAAPPSTLSTDTASGVANGPSSLPAKFTDELTFSDYPIDIYHGPITYPDFAGKAKDDAEYKTKISDAVRGGVNFAGTMAIAEIDCGTDCLIAYASDVRSGDVYNLPVGGEDNYQLSLSYKPNSSLILAQWTGADFSHPTCVHAFFQWTGGAFKPLQKREMKGECPSAP